MKFLSVIIFILLWGLNAHAKKVSAARDFQANILFSRVEEVLTYRLNEMQSCLTTSDYQDFQIKMNLLKGSKGVERVENALFLLGSTRHQAQCADAIVKADEKLHKIQRQKFQKPIKLATSSCSVLLPKAKARCLENINRLIVDLDPFCVTQNAKDKFGVKDPNACMAGDRLLGKVLRKNNDPSQQEIADLLFSLADEIKATKERTTIDLWSVFLKKSQDTAEKRNEFLALMAFFYYALGSAGGYVDGIADHYWMSSFEESLHPQDAFPEFYSMRQKVDWYGHLLKKEAKKKKIAFTFKHIKLEGLNRHDYMAMFLACEFRDRGELVSKAIPLFLGVGYESLDFVSHIKEHKGLKASLENFKKDSSRYSVGSKIGNSFCAYKF